MTNDVVAEMIAVIRAEEERRRKARRHDVNERFAYVAGSRMREDLDVYTDNSQQLTTSLERQFDKTAAVHDRGVGPRQESAASSNSRGEAVSAGPPAQQGHSAQKSSSGQELGHGR